MIIMTKRAAWNKGLTKETDERVKKYADSLKKIASSEDYRKKISVRHKGKKLSDDHKQKISNSLRGEKNPFYGKHHTEKTKNKIGKANSGIYEERFGKEKAALIRTKMSESKRGEKNSFYGKHHTKKAKSKMGRDVSGENNPMYGKGHLLEGEKNGAWMGGISPLHSDYNGEFTQELKLEIRQRDGFVCGVCGKNGWVVHHIDYNKHNNNPSNLITVCSSCHGKTGFNREMWIKLFTKSSGSLHE